MANDSDVKMIWPILTLSLAIRLWAINWGLPETYHADEPIVVHHALEYGMGSLNPYFFRIPPLTSYILFIFYGIYYLVGGFADKWDFAFSFLADPSEWYLIGRILLGAFVGTGSVYLIYRLVKKHFTEGLALLTALFLGISFLHVRDSHYIYADIPLVFSIILAFIAFGKGPVWSGAAIGLATAFKYNGILLLIPFLYLYRDSWKGIFKAGIAGIVTYCLLNPFSIIDFKFFLQEMAAEAQVHQGTPFLHHIQYSLFGAIGYPMAVFAFFGMFSIGKLKTSMMLFTVAYYLILWRFGQLYPRYVLPMIPFLCFFAADTVLRFRKYWAVLLVILAVMPNLYKVIKWDHLMTQKDTRTQAKEWILENIPDANIVGIASPQYLPRINFMQKGKIDYYIYEYWIKDFERVKEFNPYADKRQEPIDKQPITGGPFTLGELIWRERNGQIIRIIK